MNILIISGSAPPEPCTAGRVHWDMAIDLAQNNNTVCLITPRPSRPLGVDYPEFKRTRINRVNGNFSHVQINSFTYPKYNVFLRAYESADFGIKSIRYINRKIKDYDLIYASPWAFLGQFFVILLRKRKKAPIIMNVQDLYPESFLCKFRSKFIRGLLKPLYLIDKFTARNSNHITVISESLRQVYIKERKTPEDRISIIHNWQDESEFLKHTYPRHQILEKYLLEDLEHKFVYLYLGNIGPVAGLENVISACVELKNKDAVLIIAGSGTYKAKCQAMAKRLQLRNVGFLHVPQGLNPVAEIQSIADILLLPIHPEAANSSIPSKLIAYMFSGKPVITSANKHSETAGVVEKSDCGWVIPSNEDSEWSMIMNLAYKTKKETLVKMGKAGFDYAMKYYSRKEGVKKISDLFHTFKTNNIQNN